MTSAALESLLKRLPQADHPAARRRIDAAEALGWKQIGFWAWGGKATLADLAAVLPDGKGRLHFLSELDETTGGSTP